MNGVDLVKYRGVDNTIEMFAKEDLWKKLVYSYKIIVCDFS